MDLSFKIEGLERISKASDAVVVAVNKELDKALYVSGKKIEEDAKKSILDGNKTGRIYQRRTVTHRASAPGEAPASDTGRLVNSINTYLNRSDKSATVVAGRGSVIYARMLEFGTRLIAARPFMHPAAEKNREWIRERLNQAVRKGALSVAKK